MKLVANLNFNGAQALNKREQNVAGDPGSPLVGQTWFDTTNNRWRIAKNASTVQTIRDTGITIVTGDIDATLKPSGSAAAGTEALRALGATASTAMAGNSTLNSIATATGATASITANSQKITNLAAPTAGSTDAANAAYVDAAVSAATVKGVKDPVRAASTANVTIATPGAALDGVTLASGDRVLLKDQSTGSQNGIYVWTGSAAALTRALDADTAAELPGGTLVSVLEGTINSRTVWEHTTTGAITLGTTALTFGIVGGQRLDQVKAPTATVSFNNQLVNNVSSLSVTNGISAGSEIDAQTTGGTSASFFSLTTGAIATSILLLSKRQGDSFSSFQILTDGTHQWLDSVAGGVLGQLKFDGVSNIIGARNAADSAYANFRVADPVNAADAATKAYVDATAQGLDVKASVRALSTTNVAIPPGGTTLTVDGVSLANGDRVLLTGQSTASQNGIYVVGGIGTSVTLTRSTDADTSAKVTGGLFTFVTEGTANADSGWVLATNDAIVLGTTALAFTQFSGAGQVVAGAGLTKTGNTLDVVAADGSITVAADSVTVGLVPVGKGGTNATTAAAARTNLGAVGKFATTVGDGAATSFTVTAATHGLGNSDLQVHVYEAVSTTKTKVEPDIAVDSGTFDVTVSGFTTAPALNSIRIVIFG